MTSVDFEATRKILESGPEELHQTATEYVEKVKDIDLAVVDPEDAFATYHLLTIDKFSCIL